MEYVAQLIQVSKRFASILAVDDVSLQIRRGEFLTLLGPSGCGKTTVLRMLSGFETPTGGQIILDGKDVTLLPPYRRNVNQVFQSYALFPHLSVRRNIEFGLKMQKLSRTDIRTRVNEAIELVDLPGLEDRKPSQLSGGQKQRVALARAIVCRPRVLLLDEPLSALDAKLRQAMQIELKGLQQRLGITFVFVTHDQDEALVMSNRIAVMNQGRIEQLGSAADIYHHPLTTFVAGFVGQTNLLQATLANAAAPELELVLPDGTRLRSGAGNLPAEKQNVSLSIRPEKLYLQRSATGGENEFPVQIEQQIFHGATSRFLLRTTGGLQLIAVAANESASQEKLSPGEKVWCHIHRDDLVFVRPPAT